MLFPYMNQPRAMTREQIGPGGMVRPQPEQARPTQNQGGQGYMGPSQNLFQAYMNQIFNQKYRPQQALGGYQNFGSYGAFMPYRMPMQAKAQPQPSQSPIMNPGSPTNGMIPQSNGQYIDPSSGKWMREIDLLNP